MSRKNLVINEKFIVNAIKKKLGIEDLSIDAKFFKHNKEQHCRIKY